MPNHAKPGMAGHSSTQQHHAKFPSLSAHFPQQHWQGKACPTRLLPHAAQKEQVQKRRPKGSEMLGLRDTCPQEEIDDKCERKIQDD